MSKISDRILTDDECKLLSHIDALERIGTDWNETLPAVFDGMYNDPMENWNWSRIFVLFAWIKGISMKTKSDTLIPQLHSILDQFIKSRLTSWVAAQGGWGAMPQFELYFE
jgi:hypothetical protein